MIKKKILVIEDDPGDLFFLEELLEEERDFQLKTAMSLSEGLEKLKKEEIDLVLLDLTLPDSRGITTFEKLNLSFPLVPVVILTGLDDREIAIKSVYLGAEDYLPKQNLEKSILLRSIVYALERSAGKLEKKLAEEELKSYSDELKKLVTDKTLELQEIQEKLLRQEKLAILGQLAGSVAHELRNPLGVISNAVYFIKMTLPESEGMIRDYIEIIGNEVERSNKIITDLLDFSRNKPSKKEETSLSELISMLLEKYVPQDSIKLENKITPDLSSVFIDREQIEQVFLNLIINAYQSMPDGGVLTISAKNSNNVVNIYLKDTGCGISEENQRKIFEPLFTTKVCGIGLGLAVVQNLISVNNGKITVESSEGEGTTFTVTLPVRSVMRGLVMSDA